MIRSGVAADRAVIAPYAGVIHGPNAVCSPASRTLSARQRRNIACRTRSSRLASVAYEANSRSLFFRPNPHNPAARAIASNGSVDYFTVDLLSQADAMRLDQVLVPYRAWSMGLIVGDVLRIEA